jgi:hypothetical protein
MRKFTGQEGGPCPRLKLETTQLQIQLLNLSYYQVNHDLAFSLNVISVRERDRSALLTREANGV